MTVSWGTDDWGNSFWATDEPVALSVHLDNWPLETVVPTYNEPIHDILSVISLYVDETDQRLEDILKQRFLQTATGAELEKLAAEVGIVREGGETDEHLRYRTLLAKAGSRCDGTLDSIETVLAVLFGSKVNTIEITPVSNSPTLAITIPQTLLDDIPLSETELETGLQRIVPAGDPVTVATGDTFIFGESARW